MFKWLNRHKIDDGRIQAVEDHVQARKRAQEAIKLKEREFHKQREKLERRQQTLRQLMMAPIPERRRR